MSERKQRADRFQLNTLNGIFLAIAFVFFTARFLLGGNFSSYAVGQLAGGMMAAVLFPYVIGYVAYLISFRNVTVGRFVFNLLVVMLVLGQLAQAGRRARIATEFESLSNERQEFVDQTRGAESIEEAAEAHQQYSQGVKNKLQRIESEMRGTEKEAMRVMRTIASESESIASSWQTALAAVEKADILDPALLTTDAEFSRQQAVVNAFIDENQRYREHFEDMLKTTITRLNAVDRNNDMVKGIIVGARKAYDEQKPVFGPLLDAYDGYADSILSALRLLQSHQGEWTYDGETIEFDTDSAHDNYAAIVDRMVSESESANRLSAQLLGVIETLD